MSDCDKIVWKEGPLVPGKIYNTVQIFEPGWGRIEGYSKVDDPAFAGYPAHIRHQRQWTKLPNGQVVKAINSWHSRFQLVEKY